MTVLEKFAMRDIASDIDIQVEPDGIAFERRPEHIGDPARFGVVGRYTVAGQAPWSRQPVEHLDLHVATGKQLLGGVTGGGAGADDSDTQRSAIAGQPLRGRRGDDPDVERVVPEPGRVHLCVAGQFRGQVIVAVDRVHRAGFDARPAVDAGVGVDVQHFGGGEARIVRARPDAVDRAFRDATGIVAATLRDYVGHGHVLMR